MGCAPSNSGMYNFRPLGLLQPNDGGGIRAPCGFTLRGRNVLGVSGCCHTKRLFAICYPNSPITPFSCVACYSVCAYQVFPSRSVVLDNHSSSLRLSVYAPFHVHPESPRPSPATSRGAT